MTRAVWLVGIVLAITSPAAAQYRPQPMGPDARLQVVEYRLDRVVMLEVAPGYQLSLEFAPDERIESVAVGDSSAWMVSPTKRGDHLFVKPVQPGVSTNMTVVTDVRTYAFDLQPLPGPSPMMAFTVRFTYPTAADNRPDESAAAAVETLYRISGDRKLRPSALSDDGLKTYIEWPKSAAMPAVYAINDQGKEALVNGVVQDGLYVIDGVSNQLVFRIDRRSARATRMAQKAER